MFMLSATTLGHDVEVQSNKNQGFLKSIEMYVLEKTNIVLFCYAVWGKRWEGVVVA